MVTPAWAPVTWSFPADLAFHPPPPGNEVRHTARFPERFQRDAPGEVMGGLMTLVAERSTMWRTVTIGDVAIELNPGVPCRIVCVAVADVRIVVLDVFWPVEPTWRTTRP